MKRGRPGVVLSEDDRRRLRKFRAQHGANLGVPLGLPALRTAMQAPFTWETLQRALAGKPVDPATRSWILGFLDRYIPAAAAAVDYKSRAAGEREEEPRTRDAKRDNAKSFANNETDEFEAAGEAASLCKMNRASELPTLTRVRSVGRATPRAVGEHGEENGKETESARTVRGSR